MLFMASVIIFVAGVMVSLSGLLDMEGLDDIIGLATSGTTGAANVSVTATTQVNISVSGTTNNTNLSFGSGSVHPSYRFCNVLTNGFTSAGCVGIASPSARFVIENIGNQNVTINVSADKDADALLGGTASINEFVFNMSQGSESGCTGTLSATDFQPFNTTTTRVCSELNVVQDDDTIFMDVNLTIPDDSKTGALGATITITALSA